MTDGSAQQEQSRDALSLRMQRALDGLVQASRALPVCDRAAKLHAALRRLITASDSDSALAAARALAAASTAALQDDPWFQFHTAADRAMALVCDGDRG